MRLDPEERAMVETYLRTDPRPGRRWMGVLVAGAAVCVAALILLAARVFDSAAVALLIFVLGLVAMAYALDDRKAALLGRIIRKYDRALREAEADDEQS